MENYQLYRTNVLLGGQVKWDLLLNSFGGQLLVSDFHLSPISKSVPYNKYSKENLLNYTHNENLKRFYNKIGGSFYDECIDPKLEDSWPIICKPGEKIDTHDNTYEMGCRRAQYGIYKRQFEFFCPLWIEKLSDNDVLKFKISVKSYHDSQINSRTVVTKILSIDNIKNQLFHNRFVNYFNNYIKLLNINKGNDDILSVHLDKGISQISGLDVKTGNPSIKDLSYLVKNLLKRERPLMEFDSMLINEFKNNHMIISQLFNFNLCFNIDDLIPSNILNDMAGQFFTITVQAYVDNNQLDNDEDIPPLKMVDFYSNYEYIEKKKCGPKLDDSRLDWKFISHMHNPIPISNKDLIYSPKIDYEPVNLNVLHYLRDYKCIDIIDKNKIVQSIIHWSLYDNNDYILNAYDGFGGYAEGDIFDHNILIECPHLYDDTPNIQQRKYTIHSNNVGWCNYIIISKKDNPIIEQGDNENYLFFADKKSGLLRYSSDFSQSWINNIKYYDNRFEKDDIKNLRVLLIKLVHVAENNPDDPDQVIKSDGFPNPDDKPNDAIPDYVYGLRWFEDLNKHGWEVNKINDNLWYTTSPAPGEDNVIYLISNKMDNLTFANVIDELEDYCLRNKKQLDKRLTSLLHKMQSADSSNNPPMIPLKKSLIINKAKSPSLLSEEIEYYKENNKSTYVLRYSGKIKPTFVGFNDRFNLNTNQKYRNYNYFYYKDYISDNRSDSLSKYQKSPYSLYSDSGLLPLYPSLDYFALKKIRITKDNDISTPGFDHHITIPNMHPSEHKEPISLINSFEYTWYNNGLNIFLLPEQEFEIITDKDNIKNIIKSKICDIYSIDEIKESKLLDYVYNLYNVFYSLEYLYPNTSDIINYKYKIKLTLK